MNNVVDSKPFGEKGGFGNGNHRDDPWSEGGYAGFADRDDVAFPFVPDVGQPMVRAFSLYRHQLTYEASFGVFRGATVAGTIS